MSDLFGSSNSMGGSGAGGAGSPGSGAGGAGSAGSGAGGSGVFGSGAGGAGVFGSGAGGSGIGFGHGSGGSASSGGIDSEEGEGISGSPAYSPTHAHGEKRTNQQAYAASNAQITTIDNDDNVLWGIYFFIFMVIMIIGNLSTLTGLSTSSYLEVFLIALFWPIVVVLGLVGEILHYIVVFIIQLLTTP